MVILKGIPSILTPELLYVLAQMGHGDELGKSNEIGSHAASLLQTSSQTKALALHVSE